MSVSRALPVDGRRPENPESETQSGLVNSGQPQASQQSVGWIGLEQPCLEEKQYGGFQQPSDISGVYGTKDTTSGVADNMNPTQRMNDKHLSGTPETVHTSAGWAIIRARCSYVAASNRDISFPCCQVFFATSRVGVDDWYDVYTSTSQSNAQGLVPKANFETLLSGTYEKGVAPWKGLELYCAMIYGNFLWAQRLLGNNPELANDTRLPLTPLQFAASMPQKSLGFVLLLVLNGVDTNFVPRIGKTALTLALENGGYDSAITLRAFGATSWDREWRECRHRNYSPSPMLREKTNNTLTKWTHLTALKLEDEETGYAFGCTRVKNEIAVKPLRENLFLDRHGWLNFAAVLMRGLLGNKPAVVEYVLQMFEVWPLNFSTAFLKSVSQGGWTVLHYAVDANQADTVKRLLERGAQVDCVTRDEGWSPLQLSAARGRKDSMKALLNCGADIFVKTPAGKTITQLARDSGHHEAASILVQYCQPRDTTRMALDPEQEAAFHTRPPKSTKQIEQAAAVVKLDTSTKESDDGGFDGSISSLPATSSHHIKSTVFERLIEPLESGDFNFKEDDERVKIAILDTGIDLTHSDWQHGRIVRFEDEQPIWEDREPRQWTRIRDFKNFCKSTEAETERHVMDFHGHGTQVAGIILRLAPRAEIYVARVCEGEKGRRASGTESKVTRAFTGIQAETVAEAIDWAIEQGVHLINMSLGFSGPRPILEKALRRARDRNIVTFAAMSNEGNTHQNGAAWPAKHPGLTVGIHSCKDELGKDSSGFTPPPVRNSNNFMVVGEGIIESRGGGFRIAEGTSFATPVATAMAARILAFIMQTTCKKERIEAEKNFGEGLILDPVKMNAVLQKVSNEAGGYHYIHPKLLWKGFNPRVHGGNSPQARKAYAWQVIRGALEDG